MDENTASAIVFWPLAVLSFHYGYSLGAAVTAGRRLWWLAALDFYIFHVCRAIIDLFLTVLLMQTFS